MQITIMYVGRALSTDYAAAAATYQKRLQPFATITWVGIKPSGSTVPATARSEESKSILDRLQASDQLLLLDERGQSQTNVQFAKTFSGLSSQQGKVVIVIGGAFGVSDAVRSRANFVWSLSELVFPHQLIRVMLLEQLYRTFAIQSGHPYHHAE